MKSPATFFALLFCISLFVACKNNEKVENPTSSEDISNWFNSNSNNELFQEEEVLAFYEARGFAPAWNREQARNSLFETLKKADEEGLVFTDYHGEKLQKLLQPEKNSPTSSPKNNSAIVDVLLTDAYLKYANHLFYGKLDPKKMYAIWGIDRKEIDFAAELQTALQNQTVAESLSDLKPQNEVYAELKKALLENQQLRQEKTSFTKIEAGATIKPGEKDGRVSSVARRLKELGLLEKNYEVSADLYDETLQNAVKKFQESKGLAIDGVLGNSTVQEMNLNAEDRYHQLLTNLERWRWYPRNLGEHYILINIPNYRLAVVKNGDTIRRHNVIAGDKTHHTPVFSDSVQYVVLNPEWNIPSSIRNKEIIPKAASNPGYLANQNIYITNSDGERVNPSTIDWSGNEAKNYRFTQSAGASNSLGKIKIIYPNQYAIYLHDTPAQAIFEQNSRAESHGCVRVENVVDLTAYLLNDQKKWSLEHIKKVIASGKTQKIPVTQTVKIHHFYWTAWQKDGKTIFINDVYGLDKTVYSKLLEKE